MKNLLGNSCARGCLVYVVALVLIVVLTSVGLGGLKGRFQASSSNVSSAISALTTGREKAPDAASHASGQVGADSTPAATDVPSMPSPPPLSTAPAPAQGSANNSQSTTPQPSTGQVGAISGDASAPFYIVQGGDTLWSISQQFGTTVSALKDANASMSDLIHPGQLVYLAPGNSPQSSSTAGDASPAGQPSSSTSQGGSADTIPSMPHTGINSQP